MARPVETELNSYIVERRAQGATLREIAEETALTWQRVRFILERERLRAAADRSGNER